MYEITVKTDFSAAHQLRDYPGNCSRLHGHNWDVVVRLAARELDSVGMAVDFRAVKKRLAEIIETLDHSQLNELPDFRVDNPTSEVLAKYIFERLSERCNDESRGVRVSRVEVSESPRSSAAYYE